MPNRPWVGHSQRQERAPVLRPAGAGWLGLSPCRLAAAQAEQAAGATGYPPTPGVSQAVDRWMRTERECQATVIVAGLYPNSCLRSSDGLPIRRTGVDGSSEKERCCMDNQSLARHQQALWHIYRRSQPAVPWRDGVNLPWDDPLFSRANAPRAPGPEPRCSQPPTAGAPATGGLAVDAS